MSCLNKEEFEVVENMSKHGGSFVKALAECFHHADQYNKMKLKLLFQDYWTEYSHSKWNNNLAEQADQDCKESLFTGNATLIK